MECPHCGEENLLGAVNCMACGGSMYALPGQGGAEAPVKPAIQVAAPFPEPEAPEKPPPEAEVPAGARCKICLEPFETAPGSIESICPSCAQIGTPGADLGPNQVQMPPAQPEWREGYSDRLGSSDLRPQRVMNLKVGVRRGPIAVLVAIVLTIAGFAVIHFKDGGDHMAIYFREVGPKESDLKVAAQPDQLLKYTTNFNLRIVRSALKASFMDELTPTLDLTQHSRHTCQLLYNRDTPTGTLVDLQTENLLVRQEGVDGKKDGSETRAYPWVGQVSTHQAELSIKRPACTASGGHLVPGVDVTPLLTLASISAPDALIHPGKRWLASVELPLMARGDGRLMHVKFACRVSYEGRKLVAGYDCIAMKLTGKPPRDLPAGIGNMNRSGGQLAAALFYDIQSGLIVEGHLDLDVHASRDRGRVEEEIRVVGRVTIER